MVNLTGITTTPDPPIANTSTDITVEMDDTSQFQNMKLIISSPIYSDNQLNGGVWGGGNGFMEINCSLFELLDELTNIPTNVEITEPENNAYLLLNQSYTYSGSADNATNYDWNFGDDTNVVNGQTVTHTYTSTGTFTILMNAINENGYASISQTVNVGTLPVVNITSPSSNLKYRNLDEIEFTIDIENYTNIKWDFGDGTVLDNATDNVTHIYQTQGTYTAVVTVTNNYGTVTENITITVYQRPTDVTIISPVPTGLYYARIPVSFVGIANGAISYQWNFGDNITYIGSTAQHTYAGPGTYTVTFTAYTDHVSDSTEVQIIVLSQ